jgi:hypothetical protein
LQNEVHRKVDAVKEKVQAVKRSFDLPHQVRQHPWPMVGASIAVGFVLGKLRGHHEDESRSIALGQSPVLGDGTASREDAKRFRRRPGMFAEEADLLRQTAVGAVMALVRNALKTSFPGIAPQTDRLVDGITRKLGGEPVAGLFDPPTSEPPGFGRSRADYGTTS